MKKTNRTEKKIIQTFQCRLENLLHHHSPEGKFFSIDYIASSYRNLFGIIDSKNFDAAFEIVAYGQGNEIIKMNSLQSSSLLSLLFFYPLFGSSDKGIQIDNITYNKCFFEIKNKVITNNRPSCIDIVLWSEKSKKLLYLESKFTEYIKVGNNKTYGKSYYDLYDKLKNQGVFNPYFSISRDRKEELVITTKDNEEQYIDGIKQTISHLIGIFRGPEENTDAIYSKEYLSSYLKIFEDHNIWDLEIEYATILYNPKYLEDSSIPEYTKLFTRYLKLYTEIIGEKGDKIIKEIPDWCKEENLSVIPNLKKIKIRESPLIYQELPWDYIGQLPEGIREFYNFKNND